MPRSCRPRRWRYCWTCDWDRHGSSGSCNGPGSGMPMLAALLAAQGGAGLVLERRADDYAARTAGVDATRRALEKLAAINLVKHRTGRLWNLLQQHPGMAQRIERVRRAGHGHPAVT